MASRQFADLSRYVTAANTPVPSALDAFIQQTQLDQKTQNDELSKQLALAIQQANLQKLQRPQVFNTGAGLAVEDPNNPAGFSIISGTTPTSRAAAFQSLGLTPQNYQGPVSGVNFNPTTGEYSTVPLPKGVTEIVPKVTPTPKPVNVRQFTDANGLLFEQSLAGGPATPVLDPNGVQINRGVANQIIYSDQGVMTIPSKGQGNPNAQPVTGVGGVNLTKTPSKGGTEEASSAYQEEAAFRNLQSITDLKSRVSPWTTGAGSLLSKIPGTEATNFAADLNTLKANIAFGELTAMRAASKTGGALGQVSDKEGKLLQSSLGALDTSQSGENFLKNLNNIEASINRWKAAQAKAVKTPSPSVENDPLGLFK